MEVSGQLDALAALPPGKAPRCALSRRLDFSEKFFVFALVGNLASDCPAPKPSRYTDYANPAPISGLSSVAGISGL